MKLKKAARILSAVLVAAALLACGALASGQVIYDTDEPISPWLEALAEEHLVDGQYPVNSKGQTYGPQSLVRVTGQLPDLISAVGEDGVEGYILREDVEGPEVNTPEEAFESMLTANDRLIIPLFDAEGNEIGTFHITPVSEEQVEGAREALARMRGE